VLLPHARVAPEDGDVVHRILARRHGLEPGDGHTLFVRAGDGRGVTREPERGVRPAAREHPRVRLDVRKEHRPVKSRGLRGRTRGRRRLGPLGRRRRRSRRSRDLVHAPDVDEVPPRPEPAREERRAFFVDEHLETQEEDAETHRGNRPRPRRRLAARPSVRGTPRREHPLEASPGVDARRHRSREPRYEATRESRRFRGSTISGPRLVRAVRLSRS
jgi:hypothetical protein